MCMGGAAPQLYALVGWSHLERTVSTFGATWNGGARCVWVHHRNKYELHTNTGRQLRRDGAELPVDVSACSSCGSLVYCVAAERADDTLVTHRPVCQRVRAANDAGSLEMPLVARAVGRERAITPPR